MREIEIKLKVGDPSALEAKLAEKGCVLSAPINQRDVIYSNKGAAEFESAKEGDLIIRIRHLDQGAELNLKKQLSGEMDNLEYETPIGDAKAANQILLALGWKPEIEVKKVRREGKLNDFEICLDHVEGLGDYIEIEKLTDDNANPAEVREELFKIAESLGLSRSDEETRGYDTQMHAILNP